MVGLEEKETSRSMILSFLPIMVNGQGDLVNEKNEIVWFLCNCSAVCESKYSSKFLRIADTNIIMVVRFSIVSFVIIRFISVKYPFAINNTGVF